MTRKPTDHFSLTALRKSINEHPSPLFTLTKAEMEGMVGRLEEAERLLTATEDLLSVHHTARPDVIEWLASLEAEG